MKNLTVAVDEDLYNRVRVRAAETQTTVSALVRGFLERLVEDELRYERLQREHGEAIDRIREEHPGFGASDRMVRDRVHERT